MRFTCLVPVFLLLVQTVSAKSYDNASDPQRQRIREQVMQVFETQGVEAGKRALHAFFLREMTAEGPDARAKASKLYENLWKQAQLHTPDREVSTSIFEYIFMSSLNGDTSGKTMCYSGFILINLLTNRTIEDGRLQKSREIVELGKRMSRYHYIDATLEAYPVRANALLPEISGVPSRAYAVTYPEYCKVHKVHHQLPRGYMEFYLHDILKDVAYFRGEWEEAAQYADWLRQYGELYWDQDRAHRLNMNTVRHGKKFYQSGTELLANVLELHGYEDAALEHRSDLVLHHPVEVYRTWYFDQMKECEALIKTNEPMPELDRWLLMNEVQMQSSKFGGNPAQAIINRVCAAFAGNDTEKGMELLGRMGLETEVFQDAVLQCYEFGLYTHPELEFYLIRELMEKRAKGLKIEEPRLYRLYASLLADQGRWEEALIAQQECVRLYHAMRITNRALAEHATYLTYLHAVGLDDLLRSEQKDLQQRFETTQGEVPEWVRENVLHAIQLEDAASTQSLNVPAVDLQPRTMRTVTLPGNIVRTRFTLSNPAQVPQTGKLMLEPSGTVTRLDEQTLQVFWSDNRQGSSLIPMTLPPYSEHRLYLVATLEEEGVAKSVALKWLPEEASSADGNEWTFAQGSRGESLALTNASQTEHNPFYLVPIYQSLVRSHADGTQRVPIRVVCSQPTRVEMYRESDQLLMFVDDNGDGDLSGSGDVLFGDEDGTHQPEVVFPDGEDLAGILLYVLPEEGFKKPVEIEVSIWIDGTWVLQTVHVLEP